MIQDNVISGSGEIFRALLEQILSFEMTTAEKGGKSKTGRVVSPESAPIFLNPVALRKTKIVYWVQ